MAAGNLSCNVDPHGHGESPTQSDIGVATMDRGAWSARRKQNNHGDHAGAEEDQDEGSEKLGNQLGGESGLEAHAVLLLCRLTAFSTASSLTRIRGQAAVFSLCEAAPSWRTRVNCGVSYQEWKCKRFSLTG